MAALLFYFVIVLVPAIFNRAEGVPSDMDLVLLTYNPSHDTCKEVTDFSTDVSKRAANQECEQAFLALERLSLNGCHGWRNAECRLVDDDLYQHYQCTCLIADCDSQSVRSGIVRAFRHCAQGLWTLGVNTAPTTNFQQGRSDIDDSPQAAPSKRPRINPGHFGGASSSRPGYAVGEPSDSRPEYALSEPSRSNGVHAPGEAGTSSVVCASGEAGSSSVVYALGDAGPSSSIYASSFFDSPIEAYSSYTTETPSWVTGVPVTREAGGPVPKPHECDECGAKLRSTRALFDHKRAHHTVSDLHCYMCNKGYKYRKGFLAHLRENHPELAKEEVASRAGNPAEVEEIMPYSCPFCGKRYSSDHGYTDHIKSHTTDDTKCPVCKGTFSTRAILKTHMEKQHPGEPIPKPGPIIRESGEGVFECRTCGREYVNKRSLWDHEQCHKNMDTYCPDCDRTFLSKNGYTRHMQTQHPERAATDQAAASLQRERERPEKCNKCDKRFRNAEGLKEHQAYHDGKTKCKECGKVFPRRSSLSNHRRQEHPHTLRKRRAPPK